MGSARKTDTSPPPARQPRFDHLDTALSLSHRSGWALWRGGAGLTREVTAGTHCPPSRQYAGTVFFRRPTAAQTGLRQVLALCGHGECVYVRGYLDWVLMNRCYYQKQQWKYASMAAAMRPLQARRP